MTEQTTTDTMTPDQMLAYESGRKQGMKEAAKIARDWWFGCNAETPHQLIEQAMTDKEAQP